MMCMHLTKTRISRKHQPTTKASGAAKNERQSGVRRLGPINPKGTGRYRWCGLVDQGDEGGMEEKCRDIVRAEHR